MIMYMEYTFILNNNENIPTRLKSRRRRRGKEDWKAVFCLVSQQLNELVGVM